MFDSSNWTVNTGSGSATSSRSAAPSLGGQVAGLMANPAALLLLAIVAVLAVKHLKK
jgi:hypothetical protein